MSFTLDPSGLIGRMGRAEAALIASLPLHADAAARLLVLESGYAAPELDETGDGPDLDTVVLAPEVEGTTVTVAIVQLYDWAITEPHEHCFPAGTAITTLGGTRPIEQIVVGDEVLTRAGYSRVRRCFRHQFGGVLQTVTGGGQTVACTPNHPFLTQRGWIRADDLGDGDYVMRLQHGAQSIQREFGLPDPDNGVPAGAQVGIPGGISPLLSPLSVGESAVSRVAMPVVPVSLQDHRSNTEVHDEVRLDDHRLLKRDPKVCKHLADAGFEFARFVAQTTSPSFGHRQIDSSDLFRMIPSPIEHLLDTRRIVHRVSLLHMPLGRRMDDSMAGFGIEPQAQNADLVGDLESGLAHLLRERLSTALGVVPLQVLNFRASPAITGISRVAVKPGSPALATAAITAGDARTAVDACPRFDRRFRASVVPIAASQRTESLFSRLAGRPAYHLVRSSAPVAGSLQPNSAHDLPLHPVYNIEVEGAHEYIANGFVVHNCQKCLEYAAGGPYTADFPDRPETVDTHDAGNPCWCIWAPRQLAVEEYGPQELAVAKADIWQDITQAWSA